MVLMVYIIYDRGVGEELELGSLVERSLLSSWSSFFHMHKHKLSSSCQAMLLSRCLDLAWDTLNNASLHGLQSSMFHWMECFVGGSNCCLREMHLVVFCLHNVQNVLCLLHEP